jgi:predicted PurR-regulated permease PerM
LRLMIGGHARGKEISDMIERIKWDIKSYFVIKTVVSFITWALSYIVMQSFGLDFALFWAFLIFALNYIPSIWSIIAVTFPALLSLIQFDSYYTFVFMTSFLVGIQTLMWNIIEPKFVGNKLNLSPLVIIISLWFWWAIWWVVWMLLSVPIMVIINIVLAKIPSTRPIAILLSEKWELQIEGDVEVEKTRRKFVNHVRKKFRKW